jgi:hypothetical protein
VKEEVMINIKSLDKLREFVEEDNLLMEMIDAVEKEIAEKYIALPLDSEGVPIHPGDTLKYCSEDIIDVRGENLGNVEGCEEVLFIAFNGDGECIALESDGWSDLSFFSNHDDMNFVHATKPRKLEDVLYECFHDCMYKYPAGIEDTIVKYADEIRGLMSTDS